MCLAGMLTFKIFIFLIVLKDLLVHVIILIACDLLRACSQGSELILYGRAWAGGGGNIRRGK